MLLSVGEVKGATHKQPTKQPTVQVGEGCIVFVTIRL